MNIYIGMSVNILYHGHYESDGCHQPNYQAPMCTYILVPRIVGIAYVVTSSINSSNAEALYFRPKHKDANIDENHLNPVMWYSMDSSD